MSLDVYIRAVVKTTVYDSNITHNLGAMALQVGLYYPLWRPEEIGISRAGDLIPFLKAGLKLLKDQPEHFEKYNPENSWGNYDNLVLFVERYLEACEEYPDGEISVCR